MRLAPRVPRGLRMVRTVPRVGLWALTMLLLFASSRPTEAAWVLWSRMAGNRGTSDWEPKAGTDRQEDCDARLKQQRDADATFFDGPGWELHRGPEGVVAVRKADGQFVAFGYRCLPEMIDPRTQK